MSSKRREPVMSQADRFIEAAGELGCDEGEDVFERAVRKVAKRRHRVASFG